MRKLSFSVFLVLLILPFRVAQPSRLVTQEDLIGIYESGESSIPWFQIEKSNDGKNLVVYSLSQDLMTKIPIFTSESGVFPGPFGTVSSQAVSTGLGFFLVQSERHTGAEGNFLESKTVGFSQFEKATGSVLRVQWHSVRFSKESLTQGLGLTTDQVLYFHKIKAI